MQRSTFHIVLFVLLLCAGSVRGQGRLVEQKEPDPKFARFCMEFGNYYDAQREYERLLKKDATNVLYKYNLGKCHLYQNVDKQKAIPLFLWVSKQEKADIDVWYDLGHAYFVTDQLDSAKINFQKYLSLVSEDKHFISAKRMLEMIANAEKAISRPVNVEMTNLGKRINTSYPEFNPFITKNEKMLVFSSQRKMNLGNYRYEDGYYAGDLWMTVYKFEKWKKSKRFSSMVNSKNIEFGGSMSPDGRVLMVYNQELLSRTEHISYSEKQGRFFRKPKVILEGIEGVKSAVFSPDNRRIYFVMKRKEGIGGLDIYYIEKDIYNKWGAPIIDSVLSTPYNDHYPSFGPDGNMYYCSEGHNSMGGYDLFKVQYDRKTSVIGEITNMGYPVNTTRDDMTISFSESTRYGYIASLREGGFGDLDIYRVVFKDVDPVMTVVRGKIFNQDSVPFTSVVEGMNAHIDTLNIPINHKYKDILRKEKDTTKALEVLKQKIPYENVDVNIVAIDQETNEVFGKFIAKNANANYAVILPPGKWKLVFMRKGYQDYYLRDVLIEDRSYRNTDIEKHILLQKH